MQRKNEEHRSKHKAFGQHFDIVHSHSIKTRFKLKLQLIKK